MKTSKNYRFVYRTWLKGTGELIELEVVAKDRKNGDAGANKVMLDLGLDHTSMKLVGVKEI